ncbi:DUF11 domain-containing protein [Streptomyces sp. MK37H]|uniref:DUF11 domain-containing protein n=1 Tax=Streptomyces sp. MK37H TaxID=2699117 RepID=UPI0027E4E507|nr:DUF11 domain-containing protein [Streptomyces sp. MK37H]
MTKPADTTTVTVGEMVTYRVTVRNTGPQQATGVTATDQLPAGLTFLSATASHGSYAAIGVWSVGDLAVGASATMTLQAKATTGAVANAATVYGNETDHGSDGNADSVTACVAPAAPARQLAARRLPARPERYRQRRFRVGHSRSGVVHLLRQWTDIGPWNVVAGGVDL